MPRYKTWILILHSSSAQQVKLELSKNQPLVCKLHAFVPNVPSAQIVFFPESVVKGSRLIAWGLGAGAVLASLVLRHRQSSRDSTLVDQTLLLQEALGRQIHVKWRGHFASVTGDFIAQVQRSNVTTSVLCIRTRRQRRCQRGERLRRPLQSVAALFMVQSFDFSCVTPVEAQAQSPIRTKEAGGLGSMLGYCKFSPIGWQGA